MLALPLAFVISTATRPGRPGGVVHSRAKSSWTRMSVAGTPFTVTWVTPGLWVWKLFPISVIRVPPEVSPAAMPLRVVSARTEFRTGGGT